MSTPGQPVVTYHVVLHAIPINFCTGTLLIVLAGLLVGAGYLLGKQNLGLSIREKRRRAVRHDQEAMMGRIDDIFADAVSQMRNADGKK